MRVWDNLKETISHPNTCVTQASSWQILHRPGESVHISIDQEPAVTYTTIRSMQHLLTEADGIRHQLWSQNHPQREAHFLMTGGVNEQYWHIWTVKPLCGPDFALSESFPK